MSKKLQITIVALTIAVVLLLVGLFSLRQLRGTELPMDEEDALTLLDKLGEQGILNADNFITATTKKDTNGVNHSVIVHQTSFCDRIEGTDVKPESVNPESKKKGCALVGNKFLSEIVAKRAFESLNATKVFSLTGGEKRIQFDFAEPLPKEFTSILGHDAYACASIVFDKNDVAQSVTLYFNIFDGKEISTTIYGDVPLEAVITTGGDVVFVPIEEKE